VWLKDGVRILERVNFGKKIRGGSKLFGRNITQALTLGKKDAEIRQKQREIDQLYGKLAAGSVLTDPELRSLLADALERLASMEKQAT